MTDEPKEKKIIIDEDWKSQVEAEKEAARHQDESAEAKQPQPEQPEAEPEPTAGAAGPMPEPSLTFLAGSIYFQGMVALGLLPNPVTQKAEVSFDQAKHSIDTLAMLFEKTEGNRTAEETKEFETMLHEMRMAFVAVQQQGQE